MADHAEMRADVRRAAHAASTPRPEAVDKGRISASRSPRLAIGRRERKEREAASKGVFISYRRADSEPYAQLLKGRLRERIPGAKVFMDLDSIESGLPFPQVIEGAVRSCGVFLALIGPQWVTITGEDGQRRLEKQDDLVRHEVRTALELGKRVIPVLVGGAQQPRQDQLPPDLRPLARLHSHELSRGKHFDDDVSELIELVARTLAAFRQAR